MGERARAFPELAREIRDAVRVAYGWRVCRAGKHPHLWNTQSLLGAGASVVGHRPPEGIVTGGLWGKTETCQWHSPVRR